MLWEIEAKQTHSTGPCRRLCLVVAAIGGLRTAPLPCLVLWQRHAVCDLQRSIKKAKLPCCIKIESCWSWRVICEGVCQTASKTAYCKLKFTKQAKHRQGNYDEPVEGRPDNLNNLEWRHCQCTCFLCPSEGKRTGAIFLPLRWVLYRRGWLSYIANLRHFLCLIHSAPFSVGYLASKLICQHWGMLHLPFQLHLARLWQKLSSTDF